MNEDHDRIEELVNQALEFTPEERGAFLSGACGKDAGLRDRVETLLRGVDESEAFMAETVAAPGEALSERAGTVIGRYKLLQSVGEGGMGVVYMAEQTEPVTRKVALKIIKLGMDTKQVVARFEAERQALAMMDHSNIARVLDAGATESGRPYFVMELVRGVPITEYCDKNKLSTKERLELFVAVCQAIQHAHQKGIIHRDIKPSNVMVTLHDGRAIPKVIDFGIAKATNQKLTEKTLFTNYAQMIGTPAYMSPEQAEMSGLDVDTRTDVYSLGVLLYELLTGTTPFPSKELLSMGYGEMQRVIAETEPPKPSTRMSTMQHSDRTIMAKNRSIEASAMGAVFRGDLDWIVMKSLEKDRTHRYETVNGLAIDIGRHLRNEPVSAAAPSFSYRFQKFYRRNADSVRVAAVVIVLLLSSLLFAAHQARLASLDREQALRHENEAMVAKKVAKLREYHSKVGESFYVQRRGRLGYRDEVFDLIEQARELGGEELEIVKLRNVAIATLIDPKAREPNESVWPIHNGGHVTSYRIFGESIVFGYRTGEVRIYDVFSGELEGELRSDNRSPVTDVLNLKGTQTWIVSHLDREVLVWRRDSVEGKSKVEVRETVQDLPEEPLLGECDGKVVICCEKSRQGWIWDLADAGVMNPLEFPIPLAALPDFTSVPLNRFNELLEVSPNGREIVILNLTGELVVWDWEAKRTITTLSIDFIGGHSNALFFSPRGDHFMFLTSSGSQQASIYKTADWTPVRFKIANKVKPGGMGDGFYVAGNVPSQRLSLETGEVLEELPFFGGILRLGPDGQDLFSVRISSEDSWRVFKSWDRSDFSMREIKVSNDAIVGVAMSPENRWLASASAAREESVKVWQFEDAVQVAIEEPEGLSRGEDPSFSHDGRFMASAYRFEDTIVVWDTEHWEIVDLIPDLEHPVSVRFHPEQELVVAGGRQSLVVWEYDRLNENAGSAFVRKKRHHISTEGWVKKVTLSDDQRYIAWLSDDHINGAIADLYVSEIRGAEVNERLKVPRAWADYGFAFLPDSSRILVAKLNGADDLITEIWDLSTGTVESSPRLSTFMLSDHPLGSLITAKFRPNLENWGLRLFDVERNAVVAEIESSVSNVSGGTTWSRDGAYLLDSLEDGRVRIFDILKMRKQLGELQLDWGD